MEQKLHSSNIYSHKGKMLEQHLINAAELSNFFWDEKQIKLFKKNDLLDILQIINLSHDIGKSTKYFQEYLMFNKCEDKKLTYHSLFSAVCSYFLVKNYLKSKNINDNLLPFFSFLVIKKHHTDLGNVIDDAIVDEKEISLLKQQLSNIDETKFNILVNNIKFDVSLKDINEWIDQIKTELRDIKKQIRKLIDLKDITNYLKVNLIYSLLLDSDKSEVVINDKNTLVRDNSLSDNLVDNFNKTQLWDNSFINSLRNEAYGDVINKDIDLNKRIYSINLPTGLGKTLISLSFALKLRGKIHSKNNVFPRIIYSLPFLSIIDQNFSVFEEVLKSNKINLNNTILLKHHHLSEIFYLKNNIEFEDDMAKILIEGWNSEIIVTTFIQLFHTLISNKNKSLRKFHRLANSIIILDEIQSIPIKYWLLIKEILKALSEQFNSYIVFVTATEPLIFSRNEVIQLADKNKYFSKLDRLTLIPQVEENLKIEDFFKKLQIDEQKNYLFIFNTIENSAKKFYKLIKENKENICFLSTQIVPKERLKRIKDIKDKKYKIVISTQLVEAGVDIDFNIVYRDLAPLDSINQSAGRCNRNNNKKGTMFITSLLDENGRNFSSYIYDPVLINITRELLIKYKKIEEKDFLNIINEYYNKAEEKMSSDESRVLLDAIYKLQYDSSDNSPSIENFNLIEQDYSKYDVFIEIDEEAKGIWNEYLNIKNINDIFKRKKCFDSIKPLFYQYVISVQKNCENIPPEEAGFRYVPKNCLQDYYDIETGYIIRGGSIIW